MIPLVATVSFRNKWSRSFRLWIPLALVWLLLLPVVLGLMPLVFLACWIMHVDAVRMIEACWDVLCGLKGTNFEIENGGTTVLIHVF